MKKGAQITLVVFVIFFVISGLSVGAWFIFRQDRALAAESYLNLGDKYLKDENYSQALIAYKKAAILTPRSYAPYLKQGILAQETKHYQEAIDFINRSITWGPQELEAYLVLGETYLLNNDLANAKASFQQAKKISPTNDNISFLLFETALLENNLDEAEENILEAEKDNSLPKYKIYLALLQSFNDPTESLSLVAKINSAADINGLTLSDFSNLFQKLVDVENTTSREVMIYQTFSQLGEIDFGTRGLEKITQDNPEMRDGWVMLAYSYLLGSEPDKAKTALDKAVELDPVYPATYYLLSKYYEAKGDAKKSEETLTHAQELGFDEDSPLKS